MNDYLLIRVIFGIWQAQVKSETGLLIDCWQSTILIIKALEKIIDSSNIQEASITLTEEQKLMLSISDEDIKKDRIIDQDSLNKQELEWLKGKPA